MIQRREHAGFTLESRHTLAVMAESFREKLDGNVPAELRIGGLVDITHAACPQVAGDFVVCESASDHGLTNLCGHSIKHPHPASHSSSENSGGRNQERNLSGRPSSPGEFHPEALTEPCLSLSTHTARVIHEELPPFATINRFLLLPVDQRDQGANDLPPSLHRHYSASSLITESPLRNSASVLSFSG